MATQVPALVDRARRDDRSLAVILFGSMARGDAGPGSDVDICLVLDGKATDSLAASRTRLDYAMYWDADVQVFEQLPLYVRRRVLREGEVLFVRDQDALYALACRTARQYAAFRPYYQAYLAEVARARP